MWVDVSIVYLPTCAFACQLGVLSAKIPPVWMTCIQCSWWDACYPEFTPFPRFQPCSFRLVSLHCSPLSYIMSASVPQDNSSSPEHHSDSSVEVVLTDLVDPMGILAWIQAIARHSVRLFVKYVLLLLPIAMIIILILKQPSMLFQHLCNNPGSVTCCRCLCTLCTLVGRSPLDSPYQNF